MRWSARVYVDDCDLGRGVYAARDLSPGEAIFNFSGPILPLEEVLAKGDQAPNPVQIEQRQYIDVGFPGVFINHSCDPNAGVVDDVTVVALRLITRNEEIRFDYSTTMSERLWTMQCHCRSSHCRGLVTDFHELPTALKTKYLALGIVQRFIVREGRQMTAVVESSRATGLHQALRFSRLRLAAIKRGLARTSAVRW